MSALVKLISYLESRVTVPEDPPFIRHGKVAVLLIHFFNILSVFFSLISALDYTYNSIAFGTSLVLALGMLVFVIQTGQFFTFFYFWLFWSLALPTSIHLLSGGYHHVNVMIWGMLAPLAAAILLSVRQSFLWLILYVSVLIVLLFLEPVAERIAPVAPIGLMQMTTIYNFSIIGLILVVVLRYLISELERSRKRSDDLLLNILPAHIAERLKREPSVIADRHEGVSVLFADIVGFTRLASENSAEDVVGMLNAIVSQFDDLTEHYGLEKIKTIGDAYMVVGGLTGQADHAQQMIRFASDMLNSVRKYSKGHAGEIKLRIGVNSGPALAGVIGKKKFAFDVWGDTVNTASRMESSGEPDRINISKTTYELLKDEPQFSFEHRGKIEAKGKGEVDMYFVSLAN